MRTSPRRLAPWLIACLALAFVAGCDTTPDDTDQPTPPDKADAGPHKALLEKLPANGEIGEWKRSDAPAVYAVNADPDRELKPIRASQLDADARELVKGFDLVKFAHLTYDRGKTQERMDVRIFQMGTTSDAFGLYSVARVGGTSQSIGLDGRMNNEGQLRFVKGPYCVWIKYTRLAGADDMVVEFGNAVAEAIDELGTTPRVLNRFPFTSLKQERYYFHTFEPMRQLRFVPATNPEEMARALDLGPATNVALVWYPTTTPGERNYVFAIEYLSAAEAQSARSSYQSYLDNSPAPEDKNVAIAVAARRYLVGTFNAEENSLDDRLRDLIDNLEAMGG